MKKTIEITTKFATSLETFTKILAEAMYYETQYNFGVSEEQRRHAARYNTALLAEAREELRRQEEALYSEYADTENEDAYAEAEDSFEEIIKAARHEACKRAEQMRKINGIELKWE